MHVPTHSPILEMSLLTALLALVPRSHAQTISDPAELSKNTFIWNQEEIELGFLHFDEVFNGREVPNGERVHELPTGLPLAAFEPGGEKAQELEKYMTEQKVAGLLVLQDGKIRLERYALGLTQSGRWTSQSVAKSVTGTLVGAAIKDGYINSLDDYITDYIPDLKGSAYDKVTIHHLLSMTTGVRWTESFTDMNSDLARIFNVPIEPGMDQTVSYMRNLPADTVPGVKWVYNTGESHLLSVLVSSATGLTLADYLSAKIWVPYGMEQKASWIVNRTGQELGGCCLQATLRDFARFGQFVLEGGRIDGELIVPEDWFEKAIYMHSSLWWGWGYGYQWWVLANGTYRALGIHGQMIHIDPARRLVLVVCSAWPEAESDVRRVVADNFVSTIGLELDKERAASSVQ
jgi:CubicO group peptidase (beta-lactamase class C family)